MIFSLHQLQQKCRKPRIHLYVAFIDLTKTFDLVKREGLFKILLKISCSSMLQSMIESFNHNMKGTCSLTATSQNQSAYKKNVVKQGCILTPTLFGIFFIMLLKHAFGTSSKGIYLRTRSEGKLLTSPDSEPK